jgi:hypothetical protein
MKSRTIIVLYLILFLTGMAITGFPQGITNSGGYITGSSTNYLKVSGSGDMTLSATTADQTTLGHLSVDFTGSGTYKLTIPHDSYVTIDGNLSLADSLLLQANSSSNMASLITNGTVTGAYAIVEQHLSADQWHMVSSPVASAVSGVYTGIYLYKWNEPDSTWAFITSTTEALTVTRGYHAYSASSISSPTDVEFTGLLNTGNHTVSSLTYNSGSNKGDGWNEIGNPFPSAIEWNSSWTKSNIDNTIYMYDGTQYKTWNYTLPAPSNSLPNGEIPPTQGFWVKANASNPSLTIPNSERIHSSNTLYKGGEEIQNIISLNIEGNGYSDKMSVGMFANATNDFDGNYDAYKLLGIEAAPQLYSWDLNHQYAVNLLAESIDNCEVLLGLRTGTAEEYTISFDGIANFDQSVEIYLEDKASGEMINIRETEFYNFYTEEGTDEGRFILHFNPETTGINPLNSNNSISIYSFDKTICINYQHSIPATMHVYDLLGKEILQSNVASNQLNKFNIDSDKGYYIVKVISNGELKTQKVFIN